MKVLALDTSTARPCVAYVVNDICLRSAHAGSLDGPQHHGEQLASLILECLAGEQPDLIAVGVGPGPYTGLRVGIVTAEVLAAAWGCEVVGVPTLAALAHGYRRRGGADCVAALDVKRREIAWQQFDPTGAPVAEPDLISINELAQLPAAPLIGPAFESQKLVTPNVTDPSPVDAFDIALLAVTSKLPPHPLYLRQPDATEPHAPKSVSNG